MPSNEYKAPRERRTRSEFLQDYAALIQFMTQQRLHEDTRREILYQAIRMYSGHNNYFDHSHDTWISEQAVELCHPNGKARESRSVIKEHVVPIGVSIETLWNEHQMSDTELKKRLDAAATICIVSQGENGLLNRAKLKTSMPKEASSTNSRWARYDHDEVQIRRRKLLSLNDEFVGPAVNPMPTNSYGNPDRLWRSLRDEVTIADPDAIGE